MNELVVEKRAELALVPTLTAMQLFAPGAPEQVLTKIELEARSQAAALDVSTPSGRKELASLAYTVARTKTFVDDQGKDLVADLKKQSGAIDAERKKFRDRLDALKDEVRKPLTDFEEAEKNRVSSHELALAEIVNAGAFFAQNWQTLPAEAIGEGLKKIDSDSRLWEEFAMRAAGVKAVARQQIVDAFLKREKYDTEQAELLRLRKEAEERAQKEREERIAREATEKAERESRDREEAAARKAQIEQERVERERGEAEQRAKDAEMRRLLAEEKASRDAEEAAQRARREQDAAVERERQRIDRERQQSEEEQRKREANKKHRARIESESAIALVNCSITPEQANCVIEAIASGKVPHVRIEY